MFYLIYLGRNNIHLVKLKKKIPIFLVSLLPLYTGYLLGLEDAALVFKNFNYHYIYHSENVRVAGVTIIKKTQKHNQTKAHKSILVYTTIKYVNMLYKKCFMRVSFRTKQVFSDTFETILSF